MKKYAINLLVTLIILVCIGFFLRRLSRGIRFPDSRKLIDCTNSALAFELNVTTRPDYYFVLGVASNLTVPVTFRGYINIAQSNRTVATIPISSDEMTPCNWLHVTPGYALAWSKGNPPTRLQDFISQRQRYDVSVRFDEAPPPGSSIWFQSTKHIGD